MTTTTTTRAALARRVVAPALLALALFAGAGSAATPAAARVKGPALDSFTAGCLALQNRSDELVAEYKQVATANPNDPRLDGILAELRNNGMTWKQIGCEGVFGSIALLVKPPAANIQQVSVVNAGVLAAEQAQTGATFSPDGIVSRPLARG